MKNSFVIDVLTRKSQLILTFRAKIQYLQTFNSYFDATKNIWYTENWQNNCFTELNAITKFQLGKIFWKELEYQTSIYKRITHFLAFAMWVWYLHIRLRVLYTFASCVVAGAIYLRWWQCMPCLFCNFPSSNGIFAAAAATHKSNEKLSHLVSIQSYECVSDCVCAWSDAVAVVVDALFSPIEWVAEWERRIKSPQVCKEFKHSWAKSTLNYSLISQ